MFKKKSKIISLILLCIVLGTLCTACFTGNEPPKVKVIFEKKEIKNIISKEVWNGEQVKAVNPFQVLAKKKDKLVSLKEGDSVSIEFLGEFHGELPEKIELQIYAINKDGTFKDPNTDAQKVEVEWNGKTVTFTVPEYELKADVYGYDLRCSWGEDICRYNFIVK